MGKIGTYKIYWSLELLEGSCELNLANKVQENMIALSSELESGPTYFFYMMKEIISSTEDAVLSMIDRVKHMKMSTFDGEDVSQVTGQLRMAIKRLEVLNKIPAEIEKHVITVLQTSSVSKFNNFFAQLEMNLRQIPTFNLKINKILSMADSLYREYLQIGDWTSAKFTTPANAFVANDNDNGMICKNCGKSHPGEPCSRTYWKFIPPKPEENEERTNNNRIWFWCAKCRRWNVTHKTSQHVKRERTPKTGSNLPPSTTSTPAPTLASSLPIPAVQSNTLMTPSINPGTPTVISANVAQYDATLLSNRRRSFFREQFEQK